MDVLFLHPCDSGRSGNDVLKPKFAAVLTKLGLESQTSELWPDSAYRAIMTGPFPKRLSIFYLFVGLPGILLRIPKVMGFHAVSFNGFGIPRDKLALAERCVRLLGKKYVYHYQDNHLVVPFLREGALTRIRLAYAVIVPTQPLREAVLEVSPDKPVYVLEEGIDVDRFPVRSADHTGNALPTVVWCGNPENLKEVPFLIQILRRLKTKLDFQFRIIAGNQRPKLDLEFDWHPYSVESEPELLAGACAGLAPLAETPYARCKGGYKVKTYLAAGVPPVASPVGHHVKLVQNGKNGILATTEEEWEKALTMLITDKDYAARMGIQARDDAMALYSYRTVAPVWTRAFQSIL